MEKETLGTYLSSHPLSEVRDALRARVDCRSPISRQARRLLGHGRRDRRRLQADPHQVGTQMMFATLDDVEGQVEMLVFKADAGRERLGDRARRRRPRPRPGRPQGARRDQARRHEAERFEPDQTEIASGRLRRGRAAGPLTLRINAADFRRHPGRGAEGRLRALPGRDRGAARDADPRRARAAAVRLRLPGPALERAAGGAGRAPRSRRRLLSRSNRSVSRARVA